MKYQRDIEDRRGTVLFSSFIFKTMVDFLLISSGTSIFDTAPPKNSRRAEKKEETESVRAQ